MYTAITVYNGIITDKHESCSEITKEIFKGTAYECHDVMTLSTDSNVMPGMPIAAYDENWKLKPLTQRIAEGIIIVPEGYVVDGEEIRPMTHEEKIAAGLIQEPEQPSITETQLRIGHLKSMLAASDYQIIKSYEYSLMGLDQPYDNATIHAERQALRDQINVLETLKG